MRIRNLSFVLWMILYPPAHGICEYLEFLQGKHFTKFVETAVAVTALVVWIWIGKLLYEKQPTKTKEVPQ